jgi:hypothetical protein
VVVAGEEMVVTGEEVVAEGGSVVVAAGAVVVVLAWDGALRPDETTDTSSASDIPVATTMKSWTWPPGAGTKSTSSSCWVPLGVKVPAPTQPWEPSTSTG